MTLRIKKENKSKYPNHYFTHSTVSVIQPLFRPNINISNTGTKLRTHFFFFEVSITNKIDLNTQLLHN
uniref:Uncharacterized protein n=1 Tax=Octopus bimaculoides TaxID=37653 RepID=A0A0L8GM09_OCTBM